MGSSVNLNDVGLKLQREDVEFQRGNIADLLRRNTTTFPGAQPVSFARKHFDELQRVDYFLCEKTDGIRCLLFLTKRPDGDNEPIEEQFLIDRKNDYYYVPQNTLHIPPQGPQPDGFDLHGCHQRTLLDGELVMQRLKNGQTRLAYLIFDLMALDGQSIMDMSLDRRYGRAKEMVIAPYKKFVAKWPQEAQVQPFDIQLKKMELPYGTQMMFKDVLPNLPHGNDGLIFTCVSTPYTPGTDQHILKWKPPHENTIDFKLQIGEFPTFKDEESGEVVEDWDAKPELQLLVNHGGGQEGGYQIYAALHITDSEWEAMKRMNQMFDHRIIECWRDARSGHWRPKIEEDGTPRFRDDKKDANHISTVNSVLESIKDAVTEQDLIENAAKIKTTYKARLEQKKAHDAARAVAAQRPRPPVQQQMPIKRPAEEVVDDGPTYDEG